MKRVPSDFMALSEFRVPGFVILQPMTPRVLEMVWIWPVLGTFQHILEYEHTESEGTFFPRSSGSALKM